MPILQVEHLRPREQQGPALNHPATPPNLDLSLPHRAAARPQASVLPSSLPPEQQGPHRASEVLAPAGGRAGGAASGGYFLLFSLSLPISRSHLLVSN